MLTDFIECVNEKILPTRKSLEQKRLDGNARGGNRTIAAKFEYRKYKWKIHADSRYRPLLLALSAAQKHEDPFEIEKTQGHNAGTRLVLKPELQKQYGCRARHLYIYALRRTT